MLSSRRLLLPPTHFGITYTKMSWKYHLNLTHRALPSLTQSAPYSGRFVLMKSPVDPRIEKLQSQLLYCDYLENNMHRLPYSLLKEKQAKMKSDAWQEKVNEHLTTPPTSVALKYLKVATEVQPTPIPDSNQQQSPKAEPKLVYMPYAAEDQVVFQDDDQLPQMEYTKGERVVEEDDYDSGPEDGLDERYQSQYDQFLEDSRSQDSGFTQWRDDVNAVPAQWMADYPTDRLLNLDTDGNEDPWIMKYGTPEPNSEITSTACSGCGALLHCKDPEIPGYIPSELLVYDREEELRNFICQRCHFMKTYNVALDVKVSAEEYPKLLGKIKKDPAAKLVVLMVDLMDFPCSIWPGLQEVIGTKVPILLVANKVDLLPQDSTNFFTKVKKSVMKAAVEAGILERSIKGVALVSAKSHFGVEELISELFKFRKTGNVYLVGCTNVGKSSLFNALLRSDYCKISAVDLVKRATVAPWPGTTMNLLKFPVTRAGRTEMYWRTMRLIRERDERQLEREHQKLQYLDTKDINCATLQSRLGQSFKSGENTIRKGKLVDLFEMNEFDDKTTDKKQMGLDESDLKYRKGSWCFDTPGTIQPDQILHLLTTQELLHTLPKRIIMPRSFVMRTNTTLFLAGLGRIDVLKCPSFMRMTVFASRDLPVTICSTEKADRLYQELLRTPAFVVPVPDEERLKVWPELKMKTLHMEGINQKTSCADVVLSSAGWISMTPKEEEKVTLQAWTPEGRGIFLRRPSLLDKAISLRGPRIVKTPAYKKSKIVFGTH